MRRKLLTSHRYFGRLSYAIEIRIPIPSQRTQPHISRFTNTSYFWADSESLILRDREPRMISLSSLPLGLSLNTQHASFSTHHSTVFKWGLSRELDGRLFTRRMKGQAIHVLASPNVCITPRLPNVSPGKGYAKKEVIMVDPLEAKRLAAKQMEEIKAKENFKRKRQIEAINGAWAMIGLTAGLTIEGQTGMSIVAQLAGYWAAFISFFIR